MKTGDQVIIHCNGQRYEGEILLASPNERSLMLSFEAIIDGHIGMMPVLLGDDGVYRSIITGVEVEVVPRRLH